MSKVEGDLFKAVDRLTTLLDGVTNDRTILLAALRQISEIAELGNPARSWSDVQDIADAAIEKCQHG